ncbi:NAD(P)-dependent oxidoreductase [Exiguobacterium flavidum]|uniref:NAD(P)-dependent oxidoreductase n=1 Tax=Exiguobacterium flavidum TaxID=2184695 RepID=UPI000DF7917F|nr:NAD(P)-dependent oxidoreductase [Exiguobacterium flavidum]
MKIGIIGATGKAGSYIEDEAVERGHQVAAIVRNPSKVKDDRVYIVERDLFDLTEDDIEPFDVIVDAFNAAPGDEIAHVESIRLLISLLSRHPSKRLIVVGGAGTLMSGSKRLMDTPEFPEAYLPVSRQMARAFDELQATDVLNWTYISPSVVFDPNGNRTGRYEIGTDDVLTNSAGESYISYADYAIAVVDEIEQGKHIKKRFTAVSERS